MKRNLLTIGTVAAFGIAAAVVFAGDVARACDDAAKASAAKTTSCSDNAAKTTTASVKKDMRGNMKAAKVASTNAAGCTAEMAANCTPAQAAACNKGAATTASLTSTSGCSKGSAAQASLASTSHCSSSKGASAALVSNTGAMDAATAGTKAGGACCDTKEAKTASADKAACSDAAVQTAAVKVDELPYAENKRVTLTGAYACGHCALNISESCSPMFKTADGKVYPLMKNARVDAIKADKSGHGVELTGLVKKVDGVKVVEVKSYKVLS